jgi:hypothetical protein
LSLLKPGRLVDPAHHLDSLISFKPKLFTFKTVQSPINMFGREAGEAVKLSRLVIGVFGEKVVVERVCVGGDGK